MSELCPSIGFFSTISGTEAHGHDTVRSGVCSVDDRDSEKHIDPMLAGSVMNRAAESHVATLNGLNVHYTRDGSAGTAVVFIHGFACDLTFWRMQEPLRNIRHRILIDLPGHGRSSKPQIAYTQDLFVRSVDAVLSDAGIQKVVLIGHSMGATVALRFARQYPVRVVGLVLVDGALPSTPDGNAEAKRFADRLPGLRGPDYLACELERIKQRFIPETPQELRDEISSKMLATPQHVMVSAIEGLADPAIWDATPVDSPTLLINSFEYRKHTSETFLRQMLPKLDFQNWQGVGHFLMMEEPDQFNGALVGFLGKYADFR
jgi:pimeloyl-ACP methyl ester carboxylesterase